MTHPPPTRHPEIKRPNLRMGGPAKWLFSICKQDQPTERQTVSIRGWLRHHSARLSILIIVGGYLSLCRSADAQSIRGTINPASILRDDATLQAITCADADRVWAVGNRGAIWFSESGGDRWTEQASGTDAALFDIKFVNTLNGIIVGGRYDPETQISRGVVLVTSTGGKKWKLVSTDLPLLRNVEMNSSGHVIATGDFSATHLTSMFTSSDGGRTWTPIIQGGRGPISSVCGRLSGPLIASNRKGDVFHYAKPNQQPIRILHNHLIYQLAGRDLERVALENDGSILRSRDGGHKWQRLESEALAQDYRWNAVDEVAGTVWMVGQPGNRVVRIDPDNQIQYFATPTSTAIHAIRFLDTKRGWAAGAFGTILATRDGGQTWRVQRGGQRYASVMAVAGAWTQLPWFALAYASAEKGHRFVICDTPKSRKETLNPIRPCPRTLLAQSATCIGGGEIGWMPHFTTDSIKGLLQTYRPRVLILDRHMDPVTLQWWNDQAIKNDVQRIFETTDRKSTEVTFHRTSLLPSFGAISGDLCQQVYSILSPEYWYPKNLFLRCVHDAPHRWSRSPKGLFGGLKSQDSTRIRKLNQKGTQRILKTLSFRSKQQELVAKLIKEGNSLNRFSNQLDLLFKQIQPESHLQLIRAILRECQRTGDSELYRTTLTFAAQRYASEPIGKIAKLRLLAISNSSEWQLLEERTVALSRSSKVETENSNHVRLSPFSQTIDSDYTVTARSPVQTPASDSIQFQASFRHNRQIDNPFESPTKNRLVPKSQIKPNLKVDLLWDFDPRVLLVRAAVEKPAQQVSEPQKGPPQNDPTAGAIKRWNQCRVMSFWSSLLGNEGPSHPTPVYSVQYKPLLDGIANDLCWKQAKGLVSATGSRYQLAYDQQYLYWSATGVSSRPLEGSKGNLKERLRDNTSVDSQRLVLRVDTDGDLMTAFVLEVDSKGRTRDTCDGFSQWQPQWFVHTVQNGHVWRVEAAIRHRDLQKLSIKPGDQWRVCMQCLQPGESIITDTLPLTEGWRVIEFREDLNINNRLTLEPSHLADQRPTIAQMKNIMEARNASK